MKRVSVLIALLCAVIAPATAALSFSRGGKRAGLLQVGGKAGERVVSHTLKFKIVR
jgi:hypothetical protein